MKPELGYSRLQIVLHWSIAALIALQFLTGDAMHPAWHVVLRQHRISIDAGVILHAGLGTLVLVLVLVRFVVRLLHKVPPPPQEADPRLELLAKMVHWGLYATMLLIPVTGLVAYFGMVGWMGFVHSALTSLILLLLGLHVAGALFHQFIRRDGLIRRMIVPIDRVPANREESGET